MSTRANDFTCETKKGRIGGSRPFVWFKSSDCEPRSWEPPFVRVLFELLGDAVVLSESTRLPWINAKVIPKHHEYSKWGALIDNYFE